MPTSLVLLFWPPEEDKRGHRGGISKIITYERDGKLQMAAENLAGAACEKQAQAGGRESVGRWQGATPTPTPLHTHTHTRARARTLPTPDIRHTDSVPACFNFQRKLEPTTCLPFFISARDSASFLKDGISATMLSKLTCIACARAKTCANEQNQG